MALTSFDPGFVGAAKQSLLLSRLAGRTALASTWFSVFDLAGNPGPGVLAGTSTAAGVVPTDATAGCPTIDAFGTNATGYLMAVDFGNTVACRMKMFDMVFKAGAYSFAAGSTALAAQPSYAGRMPGGSYSGTTIWLEVSTAFVTGTAWQVQVTYTNQAGVAGRVTTITGALAAASLTLGRWLQLGLQAGDSGVMKIEQVSVTNGGTAMTAGAFNILVLRQIWAGRCRSTNDGDTHDIAATGQSIVFTDSALVLAVCPDSTSTGIPELEFVIANG